MSPAQYTKLAAQLATTHDVLERLQHCVKPANSPGLTADVIAMQGIVARMARNSWALMDETQQCRTAMTVAHIKETAANL